MNFLILVPAYPEILLIIATSVILLTDMFLSDAQRDWTYRLSLLALLGAATLNAGYFVSGQTWYTFRNAFVSDPMSNLLKLTAYVAVAMSLVYSRAYVVAHHLVSGKRGGEFYVLTLFGLLGQIVMISANNFLTIYLGLELLSLSLYATIALQHRSPLAIEAAIKYFILGALASGFLLYGMSMLYGATGTLDLSALARDLTAFKGNRTILVFGIVFIVAGLAFKLGTVPFHMWVPDVYQGAPLAVTLMISAAPKLAAFAIVLRLLVEGMLVLAVDWQQMLLVLAVLSLLIGNLAALAQKNIKRMLAYSTISHMGFMLFGLLSGVINGNAYSAASAYSASLFYVITYVFTTLAAFGVLLAISRGHAQEIEWLDDLKGLHRRSPWLAFVMLLVMLSLAGLPPTVGFYAKFLVLNALFATGMVWLLVFAMIMAVVGAFYYLRIVKLMYFDTPTADLATPVVAGHWDLRVVLVVNGIALLLFGLFPNPLMVACLKAITLTLTT